MATRTIPTRSHSRAKRLTALIIVGLIAGVLAGVACSGTPKAPAQPTATATASPQAAGAAKQAGEALKADLKPLSAPVPLPLRRLDGLAVSMNPFPPTLKDVKVDSTVKTPSVSIGAIAVPSFGVDLALGAPSLGTLLQGLPPAIPTMPSVIPTAPAGAPPGATPPAGFPTLPPGFPTPPAGFMPPGFTIPTGP